MGKFNTMLQGWDSKLQEKGSSLNNITDSALTALNSISGIADATKANAQIKDTTLELTMIDNLHTVNTDLGSYDALELLWLNTNMADTDYTWKELRGLTGGQITGNILQGGMAGMKGGAAIGGNFGGKNKLIGGAAGAVIGAVSAGIGAAVGNSKAKKEAARLNLEGFLANNLFKDKFEHGAKNIAMNNKNNALLNIAAYGGHVPTGNFTNGMTFFSEGGSHEENPYQGVLQGIAPDGRPNLVEEGEWKYKDYIYSKRLKVPKKDYEMLGLKEDKEYTYADAAKVLLKESEERPNDPISKRNLDVMMGRLLNSLETFKLKKDAIKMKKEFEKLSPEELAYMIQAMNQPQQEMPIQAQYAANGGHLYTSAGKLEFSTVKPTDVEEGKRIVRDKNAFGEDIYALVDDTYQGDVYNAGTEENPDWVLGKKPNNDNINYGAQILRSVPIIGNAIGATAAIFDKPNYSNINRAEDMYRQIPMVSPKYIGNKMIYTPLDINYLMTQIGNLNIGNRRAIMESGAGNPGTIANALLAANYKGTTAMGELYRQAVESNMKNQQVVEEFNRGTDMYNSEADFKGQTQNQSRAANIAEAFLKTGQLKDIEKATVQSNRSKALSNLFNSIGNLGTDRLNREQALAMAQSLGVTYNDILDMFSKGTLGSSVRATGGTLRKKGGKDA